MTRFIGLLVAASLLSGAISSLAATMTVRPCGLPMADASDWHTSTPEEAGMDSERLCSLRAWLESSPGMNVHAVVVVRHGKLVFEAYLKGQDEKWGAKVGVRTFTPNMLHDVRSISKSVVSLLAGAAFDRKLIASTDQYASDFFPDARYAMPGKGRITLHNLLSMTSGISWDEILPYSDPKNGEIMMIGAADPYRHVLALPVVVEPGSRWNYSGGDTQLIAGILQRATAKTLPDFAKEVLFKPLGISRFEWVTMPASGEVAAASGLRLRPRDMAKIGALMLNNGVWNGRRIISEAWVDATIQPRTSGLFGIPSLGYGYQWWTDHDGSQGKNLSWFSAQGLGGQRIYVVPAHDLVVVITAGLYRDERQDHIPFDILQKYVLATIRE